MADLSKYHAPSDLVRFRMPALGIGGIASIIVLVVALISPDMREQALRSWLLGFIFWGGIGIGCLGILLLQYLTGGAWGVITRRILEAGARTLPFVLVLWVPLAVGVLTSSVYEWTHMAPTEHVMQHRGWYMTGASWVLRSVVYFAIFIAMSWYLNGWSRQQDAASVEGSADALRSASRFSGPSMVIYCLAVSFAAIDWVMTLDPHWFSTIYGLLFLVGWALSAYCFVVIVLAYLSDKAPTDAFIGKRHFHDLGKLMLALVMVWTYFNFSQFLIIWAGNIPEETGWLMTRMKGGWGWIGAVLIFFHFGFPFLVLLHQDLKRHAWRIAAVALFVLVMRWFDMFWLIQPNPRINTMGMEQGAFYLSWMDIVAPIGIGGLWLWWFIGELLKRPVVPANDPFFPNAVEHGHGH